MIRMQVDKNRVDLRDDTRKCLFCEGIGDGTQGLTGRLLNVDANEWVHVVRTWKVLNNDAYQFVFRTVLYGRLKFMWRRMLAYFRYKYFYCDSFPFKGGLINVEAALKRAKGVECRLCGRKGASIRCYKLDCANKELAFHLICAIQSHGHFVKDKVQKGHLIP